MENVRIGVEEACAISATTELESTPPLKNAPIGTSLTMWLLTASAKWPWSRSSHSDSPVRWSGAHWSCQYLDTTGVPPASGKISVEAVGTLPIHPKIVPGARTHREG